MNWTLRNKLQWNFNQNYNILIHKNAFESVVCEMASILSRAQCVKRNMHNFVVSYRKTWLDRNPKNLWLYYEAHVCIFKAFCQTRQSLFKKTVNCCFSRADLRSNFHASGRYNAFHGAVELSKYYGYELVNSHVLCCLNGAQFQLIPMFDAAWKLQSDDFIHLEHPDLSHYINVFVASNHKS